MTRDELNKLLDIYRSQGGVIEKIPINSEIKIPKVNPLGHARLIFVKNKSKRKIKREKIK